MNQLDFSEHFMCRSRDGCWIDSNIERDPRDTDLTSVPLRLSKLQIGNFAVEIVLVSFEVAQHGK